MGGAENLGFLQAEDLPKRLFGYGEFRHAPELLLLLLQSKNTQKQRPGKCPSKTLPTVSQLHAQHPSKVPQASSTQGSENLELGFSAGMAASRSGTGHRSLHPVAPGRESHVGGSCAEGYIS